MAEAKVIVSAENRTKQGLDDAKKDLANFEQDTGGIGKKILENFTVTFGDITNLVKGAFSTVGEFVNAYAEAERALTSLKTALDISPKADLSDLEKLTKFASDLQALTGLSDDTTVALQAMLISTGRTADETMRIIKLAADYSAATGKSFQSSVEQINKTFGGSARQLGQLFPELKELSEEELKSGDALEILEQYFGGFSEKLANTAATSIAKFNETWGDMKEALGEAIMPAVQPILENLVKFLNDPVIPTIQGFAPIVKEIFTAVEEIIIGLKPVVEPVLQWFADVWGKTIAPNIQALWEIVKSVFGLIAAIIKGDWSTAWNEAKKIVENVVGIIKNSLTPLTDFAKKIWDGVKGAWTSAWEGLKAAVKGPIDAIISFFAPLIEAVQKVIKGIEAANQFITGEKRVGNFLVNKNNVVIGEYIKNKDGTETLKRYAKGTQGAAPGLALVGEEGPELVVFNGGERVIPNNQLKEAAKYLNIPGYAKGTDLGDFSSIISGLLESLVGSIKGVIIELPKISGQFYDNLMSSGLSTAGAFDGIMSALDPLANALQPILQIVLSANPLLAVLIPIVQAMVQTLEPVVSSLLAPLMGILAIIGQTLGAVLAPVLKWLSPIIELVGKAFVWLYNNVILPIANGLIWVFTAVQNAIAGVINAFTWITGISAQYASYEDAKLQKIEYGDVVQAGANAAGATAAQSAQYRSQSITINIYQQSPVVGDNGMRQFAAMIRTEFEALAYYGT